MKVGQPHQTVVGNPTVVDPVAMAHQVVHVRHPMPLAASSLFSARRTSATLSTVALDGEGQPVRLSVIPGAPAVGPDLMGTTIGAHASQRRADTRPTGSLPAGGRWWSTPGRPTARCWRRSRSWMFSSPGTQGPSVRRRRRRPDRCPRRWRRSTTSRRGGRPTWPSCGQTGSVGCACTPRPPPTSSGTRSSRPMCSWPTCRSGTSTPGSRRFPSPTTPVIGWTPTTRARSCGSVWACPGATALGNLTVLDAINPGHTKVYPNRGAGERRDVGEQLRQRPDGAQRSPRPGRRQR